MTLWLAYLVEALFAIWRGIMRRCAPSCPYCNQNRKGRNNHPGHWGYRSVKPARERICVMIKRESRDARDTSSQPLAARDEDLEAEYPCIYEYLTARLFSDGSERETATLLLFAAEGVWKCCLNDRAEERSLWATGYTHGAAMGALEAMLDNSTGEWRRSKPAATKKRT